MSKYEDLHDLIGLTPDGAQEIRTHALRLVDDLPTPTSAVFSSSANSRGRCCSRTRS